jgi:hypothetical protein
MASEPTSAEVDPLEQVCLLVGRFMYHFARVEQRIDRAVIKLLKLDEKCAPIVGLLDFPRKVDDLVRANAVKQTTKRKDKDFVNDVCSRAHSVNRYRRIIAHASFEPTSGGGVLFSRPVTEKGSVRPVTEAWTEDNFATLCTQMTTLEADLDKLIELVEPPDVPSFGWYTPWGDPVMSGRTPITLL